MDLEQLQSVRDRERQQDKPQQLRDSFYEDAAEFVDQLRRERDRVAAEAEDPYAPEARRLHDEIETAEQFIEDIYERRIGKTVKAASLDAAALPAEVDGLTREERELFEGLVEQIEHNRDRVLSSLDPDADPNSDGSPDTTRTAPTEPMDSDSSPATTRPAPTGRPDSDGSTETARTAPTDAGADRTSDPVESGGSPGGNAPDAGDPSASGTDPREESAVRDHPDPREESAVREHPDTPTDTGSDGVSGSDDDQPVRNDGGRDGAQTEPMDGSDGTDQRLDRTRVLVTEDVDTFMGADTRDYDLSADDVVQLPAANAETLLERDAARRL